MFLLLNQMRFLLVVLALSLFGCAHSASRPVDPPVGLSGTSAPKPQVSDQAIDLDSLGSDSGKIVGLVTVHFDFDRATLTAGTKELLKKNYDWMKAHPEFKMEIQGHCDRHGSDEYNLALGDRRANAVKVYLHDLGIGNDRMITVSYGKEKMLDKSETEVADQANRRANFNPIASTGHSLSFNQ